jgi:transposase
MESTGVYWMPVYAVLEGHFELFVGNATHIKNVRGRKTDVKDAEWIADLVSHGLNPQELCAAPVAARSSRFGAVSAQARGE